MYLLCLPIALVVPNLVPNSDLISVIDPLMTISVINVKLNLVETRNREERREIRLKSLQPWLAFFTPFSKESSILACTSVQMYICCIQMYKYCICS